MEAGKILGLKNVNPLEKNLLMMLVELGDREISLVSLSELVGISKPTLIRSINNLMEKGLVEKDNKGGRYSKNCYRVTLQPKKT